MKVVIEINKKAINLATSILMSQMDNEEEESKLEAIIDRMKNVEQPFFIDLDKVDDKEVKTQLPMALALFAISQEMANQM